MHVESTAISDIDYDAQARRDQLVPVDREEPEARQEDRQPFQGVVVHADGPLEQRMAGHRRRLDAGLAARAGDLQAHPEVGEKRQ